MDFAYLPAESADEKKRTDEVRFLLELKLLLVGLRRQTQIRLGGRKALRILLLDHVRVLHGQWDDDVVAVLPVARCRDRIAVRQLQGIEDAQDFIEIAARTERIREDQAYLFVRVDDEDG